MTGGTRRDFIKVTGSVAISASVRHSMFAGTFAETQAGAVRGWMTSPGKLYQPMEPLAWKPWSTVTAQSIELNPVQTYQEVLGFGGAFTDASCYLFSQMDAGARQSLLRELYGADGLNLSVGRTCIGSSDYSRTAYSFDDAKEPDPELAHFSTEHDRAYILPTLKEAAMVSPELFLFSSPWSPPGWMKSSNSLLGGAMRDHYFPAYAQYFVRFLKDYAAAGVNIQAVTVQNEVDIDQDGRMPQAMWGQQYEMKFVAKHLGPALANASLQTKIWILDHNYDLWGRVVDELSDAEVNKYVDGVAWHGYGGSPDAMTRVHNLFPEKHAYWTEGGPRVGTPDYEKDWGKWSSKFTGILRNWARCIVSWNLLLDETGKPNVGPFQCGGVVTIDSKTHALTRSGQFHAFAHYSKSIRRGARIFASSGELDGVEHVAAQNPDGSRVLVLTNRTQEQRVQCRLGAEAVELALPADSVTTLVW